MPPLPQRAVTHTYFLGRLPWASERLDTRPRFSEGHGASVDFGSWGEHRAHLIRTYRERRPASRCPCSGGVWVRPANRRDPVAPVDRQLAFDLFSIHL